MTGTTANTQTSKTVPQLTRTLQTCGALQQDMKKRRKSVALTLRKEDAAYDSYTCRLVRQKTDTKQEHVR